MMEPVILFLESSSVTATVFAEGQAVHGFGVLCVKYLDGHSRHGERNCASSWTSTLNLHIDSK